MISEYHTVYRVIYLKTVIKKVHILAQGSHRNEGRVLLCPLVAPILCVIILAL
jgi:hypothetical protein